MTRDGALLREARQRLLEVPYHRHPDKPEGSEYGYPVGGHSQYTCPVCRLLDRLDDRLDASVTLRERWRGDDER